MRIAFLRIGSVESVVCRLWRVSFVYRVLLLANCVCECEWAGLKVVSPKALQVPWIHWGCSFVPSSIMHKAHFLLSRIVHRILPINISCPFDWLVLTYLLTGAFFICISTALDNIFRMQNQDVLHQAKYYKQRPQIILFHYSCHVIYPPFY